MRRTAAKARNASPFFPAREWVDAQRTLPSDVFRQEYMAEFLEDSAGVFRNLDWDVLTNEMRRFEYAISPSGGISYGAPAGYHDDCVIALALANHRRWETENTGRLLVVGCDGAERSGWRGWGMRVRPRGRVLAG